MSKKIVIISSSPRRGGNSDILCDEFASGAKLSGNDVTKIFLKDKNIGFCTGCGACSEHGLPCPQRDDANEVVQAMIDADIIVMATPVYFYTMAAQLKTLIDRCCARYTEITNKKFYFVVTAADPDKNNLERTVDGLRGFLDCLEGAKEVKTIYATSVWKIGEVNDTQPTIQAFEAGNSIK